MENYPWMEVIGVAKDVRYTPDHPVSTDFYVPASQDPQLAMTLLARTSVDPLSVAMAVRHAVQQVDPDQPVFDILPMTEVRDRAIAGYFIPSIALSVFALGALMLAALALYSLVSYTVSRRTPEIGLRMALGAQPIEVVKLFVRQGMWLTSVGLGIGLAGGIALSRVLASLLFGITANDWVTLFSVSIVLVAAALLATIIPALRATKVDPIVALRN
jgi:putative ABC transport system permease protein